MEAVFLELANRSFSAGWLVLAVLVLRLLLRRLPRRMICFLWGLVAVRLICPFSIESAVSLIPSAQTLPPEILTTSAPEIHSGVDILDQTVNPVLSNTMAPVLDTGENLQQTMLQVFAWMWLIGLTGMLLYVLVSTLLLHRRIATATLLAPGIKQSEFIATPFVLGVLHPTIYLPYQLDAVDCPYVLAHERAHIHRHDGLWKLLGFLLLSVYWFHPLLWVAYLSLCRDIEVACDEAVIQNMQEEERRAYAAALLRCSTGNTPTYYCPLNFGEVGVKARIKRVMDYKKPGFWIISAGGIAVIIVAVCFLTNPAEKQVPAIMLPTSESAEAEQPQLDHRGEAPPTEPVLEIEKEKTEAFRETEAQADPLEAAITAAILQHNRSVFENTAVRTAAFACFDQYELAMDSDPPQPNLLILYGEALNLGFSVENGILRQTEGSRIPVAITFSCEANGYRLVEYWQPRDGDDFASDVRAAFPAEAAELALNEQRDTQQQVQACYTQAVEASGVDPNLAIEACFQELEAKPIDSSNPRDYIEANPEVFQELTYYGTYALQYVFTQFEAGGQTGLRGQLMRCLLDALAPAEALILDAETGQEYFDAWKAHAEKQLQQEGESWFRENHPAAWLLFAMEPR